MSSKKTLATAKPSVVKKTASEAKPASNIKSTKQQNATPTKVVKQVNDAPKISEAAASAVESKIEPVEIKLIKIKEIPSEISKDSSGLQNKTNKWPLIIDTEGNSKTFYRHNGSNYINCSDVLTMKADILRRAIIGAFRYNKELVLDLEDHGIDFWPELKKYFDAIQDGLFDSLMNKKILENENYLKLVKIEVDGEDYREYCFVDISSFKLIFIGSKNDDDRLFLNKFTVYKIDY